MFSFTSFGLRVTSGYSSEETMRLLNRAMVHHILVLVILGVTVIVAIYLAGSIVPAVLGVTWGKTILIKIAGFFKPWIAPRSP